MTVSISGTSGIVNDATDLNYTGTLTGGAGVVNLGSGQVYKDASGNVGIGTSSPAYKVDAQTTATGTAAGDNTVGYFSSLASGRDANIRFGDSVNSSARIGYLSGSMYMYTNGAERARIDSSGNLLVGLTSNSVSTFQKATAQGNPVLFVDNGANVTFRAYSVSADGYNAAATAMNFGKNSSTNRSINAGGTINASGADYAEYMTKAGAFSVAKGDVLGVDANGLLTNSYADAISFVVKSTDPSYVGGDVWGNAKSLGMAMPHQPSEDALDEEKTQYESDKLAFDAALETARHKVDRIAFAGQVPVNVTGATAGQYIIPVNDNGAIKGEAVSSPTFEQYQSAVGKVIAIEADGRARIIVKVA